MDVPTDCPQRDERLGWTGDAQIFCRTASYLMQTNNFFAKWLTDLKFDQTSEGGVPHALIACFDGAREAAYWTELTMEVRRQKRYATKLARLEAEQISDA